MRKKIALILCALVVSVALLVYAGQQLDLGRTSLSAIPTNGDWLIYNSSTNAWENGQTAVDLTLTGNLTAASANVTGALTSNSANVTDVFKVPSGTTPTASANVVNSLFYDTDAGGAKGSLMFYGNDSTWHTVKDLN